MVLTHFTPIPMERYIRWLGSLLHAGSIKLSDAALDQDGDGLNNTQEFEKGTNPNDSDTDGDGENDDTDIFPQDPNNGQFVDSDQDGYNDSIEHNCQSDYQDFNSIPQDTDGDGICDPLIQLMI